MSIIKDTNIEIDEQENIEIFSIIIPIYNTQEYLEKCIDSCLNQSFDKECYEIILINDGSTDSSQKIIDVYSQRYKNIRVSAQQNQGLSVTRNNGIKIARGQYIWFVDSDDWIDHNSLDMMHRVIAENNPDMVAFGAKNFIAGTISHERPISFSGRSIYSGVDLLEMNTFQTCSTFYLYSRDFLNRNDLSFYPGIYHEDVEFVPRAIFQASSVYLLNQNLYCVNEREGSITRSYIPKKSEDLLVVADSLIEFFHTKKTVTSKVISSMNTRISTALNSSLHNSKGNKADLPLLIRKISGNKKYIKCFLGSRLIKHRVEGILLNSPRIFNKLYSLFIK
jgi:glycosyltransferase involved in cell wall biosynthesis